MYNIFVYHVRLGNRWLSIKYHESQYPSRYVSNPFHNIKSNDIDLPHDINFQMILFILGIDQRVGSARSG